jgi:hypothetical protein
MGVVGANAEGRTPNIYVERGAGNLTAGASGYVPGVLHGVKIGVLTVFGTMVPFFAAGIFPACGLVVARFAPSALGTAQGFVEPHHLASCLLFGGELKNGITLDTL